MSVEKLKPSETAVVVVDMLNDFVTVNCYIFSGAYCIPAFTTDKNT